MVTIALIPPDCARARWWLRTAFVLRCLLACAVEKRSGLLAIAALAVRVVETGLTIAHELCATGGAAASVGSAALAKRPADIGAVVAVGGLAVAIGEAALVLLAPRTGGVAAAVGVGLQAVLDTIATSRRHAGDARAPAVAFASVAELPITVQVVLGAR